jgi:4-hydroxybenzoate polyprenyltransferase
MMPLRSIKGIKAFAIALVVIITGMIIPSMDDLLFINNNYTSYALYLGAQLIFIASLCIAGDIRDIREDRDDKIKTFPVITGQHFSKIISSLLLICHVTVMFLLWQIEALQLNQFELFLVIDLIGIMLISRLKETDHYYYFIMMIDGLILMQAIGLLLIERI